MPRSSVALYFLGFAPHSPRDTAEAPIRRIVVDLPELTKLGRTIPTMADFTAKAMRDQLGDDDGIDPSRVTFYASNFTVINKTTPVSVLDDGDKIIVAFLGDAPGRKSSKDSGRGDKASKGRKQEYDDDFESDASDSRSKKSSKKDKKYDSDEYDSKKKSSSSKKPLHNDSDDYDTKKKSSSSSKKPTSYDSDEYDTKKKVIKKPVYESDDDDRRKSVVKKDRPKSARGDRPAEKEKSKSLKDLGRDKPGWDRLREKVKNTDPEEFRRESKSSRGTVSKGRGDDYDEFDSRPKSSLSREKDREYTLRGSDRDRERRSDKDRRRDSDDEYDTKEKRREKDNKGDFPWDSPSSSGLSKAKSYGLSVETKPRSSHREEAPSRSKPAETSRGTAGLRAYSGRSRDSDYY
ncbi:hypothetical protein BJ741DRAFT_706436 [Chytriomyces cf. hyalinus JEL632]|nr:hypothetical protein BJ741DRAFT_706436 [Chytriomyces cf. hyalinus JEL632]